VPATSGRSRGRQGVHSGGHTAAGEHAGKIVTAMAAVLIVIVFVLVMTTAGRDIDAATQHFMLFYAGVFALIALTGSVVVGLLATDRIVMTPGHRVMAQAVHRAMSFGALAFLVIHIVTEILAQRVHAIDAFIPFLSPFRTFYIGLGTIASDLILLIVITSILRKRFTAHGKAWRWRAIHYSSYAAFVFGVLHGLLGGRTAEPYVDWSYGAAIALVALGLVVRFLAISVRPKEVVAAASAADRSAGPSPLHVAALTMAQAQLGATLQVLPAAMAARAAGAAPQGTAPWAALPADAGWSSPSGPFPALGPGQPYGDPAYADPAYAAGAAFGDDPSYSSASYFPAPSAEASRTMEAYRPADAYRDPGFAPLGAPPYGDDFPAGPRNHPYLTAGPLSPAPLAGQGVPADPGRRPLYEPGYDGPPRFQGAPRGHLPQDELSSYPYSSPSHRQPLDTEPSGDHANREDPAGRRYSREIPAIEAPGPRSAQPRPGGRNTGPMPRADSGPMRRADSGPMPRADSGPMRRADSGPMPRADSGPMRRADSGPIRRADSGPMPQVGTGPIPRFGTGPMRRADSGPMPRADSGPVPRSGTGPMPRAGANPAFRPGSAPAQRADQDPLPRSGPGPVPRPGTGPIPRLDSGQVRRPETGPIPRADPGRAPQAPGRPMPRAATGPMPRAGTGPMPRAATGPMPRAATGPMPRAATGPMPRAGTGPFPRVGPGPVGRPDAGLAAPSGTSPMPRTGPPQRPADPDPGPRSDRNPRAAARRSHRKSPADPRYREVPEPNGGDEWQ
jgi:hypothetical protein